MVPVTIGSPLGRDLPSPLAEGRSVAVVAEWLLTIGGGVDCPAHGGGADSLWRDERFVAYGRRRVMVQCFGVLRLRWGDCSFQLLVDLAAAFAGGGEFGGLGERLSEAGSGVLDLAAGVVDIGEDLGLVGFEMGEPVFQAGDQAGRVGFREVSRGEGDFGAWGAIEGWGHVDLAQGARDGDR